MAKAQARVKIFEQENINKKVPLKTLTIAGIKVGVSGSKWEIKRSYKIPG